MQRQKYFFGPNDPWGTPAPDEAQKKWMVSRENPSCPFFTFVGNEKAVRKLQAVAYDALGRENHLCREIAFSVFGPASSGKTTLVKMFAKVLGLPFVEFGPQVKSCEDIYRELERVMALEGVPLIEYKRKGYFETPPCVIFIDEIHAVADSVVQGLLKATEYNDSKLITDKGKTIDCHNVCWVIATTDEGMLFDAFRSRFSPLVLNYLTNREISTIVQNANPDMPKESCDLISFFNSRVPRKALEFARYVKIVKSMNGSETWESVIRGVAADEGIDSHGMNQMHRRVIEALAKSPVPKSRMPLVVGRKKEEVERYVMPLLLTDTDDSKALVTVNNKGYVLTSDGVNACRDRGIEVSVEI